MYCAASRPLMPVFPRALSLQRAARRVLRANLRACRTARFQAFRRGLREAGFVEGQNATIEYRWALGERERLAGLASDLVRKPVSVLVTTGGESAALEAKAADWSAHVGVRLRLIDVGRLGDPSRVPP